MLNLCESFYPRCVSFFLRKWKMSTNHFHSDFLGPKARKIYVHITKTPMPFQSELWSGVCNQVLSPLLFVYFWPPSNRASDNVKITFIQFHLGLGALAVQNCANCAQNNAGGAAASQNCVGANCAQIFAPMPPIDDETNRDRYHVIWIHIFNLL